MGIARAPRRRDSVDQHSLGFVHSIRTNQRLRGHEIPRRVLGMSGEQLCELFQSTFNFAGFRVLHGEAVTREGIVRALRKNFVEHCKSVHKVSSQPSAFSSQTSNSSTRLL